MTCEEDQLFHDGHTNCLVWKSNFPHMTIHFPTRQCLCMCVVLCMQVYLQSTVIVLYCLWLIKSFCCACFQCWTHVSAAWSSHVRFIFKF